MEAHDRTNKLAASPQLFESEFLNFFSRVHPAIPAIVFVPVIVAMEWLGGRSGQGRWAAHPAQPRRRRDLDAD